jgi:cell division protein FtsL
MPVRTGDIEARGEKRTARLACRRSATTARRRWLILLAIVLVGVAAVLANIGPLTHYREAQARLDKVTAKVDALKAEKAQLQGQVAKLSETGYLETMAREQLTYARPGEDLYIVTHGGTGSGLGAAAIGDSSTVSDAAATEGPDTESPGFLERTLNSIRDLF